MIWQMAEELCQSLSNCKKLGIAVCSSLRSTTSGLSPKNFEKRAHPNKKLYLCGENVTHYFYIH